MSLSTPTTHVDTARSDPVGSQPGHRSAAEPASQTETAAMLAEALCRGFQYHDERDYERCLDAFTLVDSHQFPHLSDDEARDAAAGYVDALWEKDAIENRHTQDGTLDRVALETADWSAMEAALRRRADIAGIDPTYATATTDGWRAHKTGGDYRTPLGEARVHELRVALDDPAYPDKSGDGSSGIGALASRYLLGVELHDDHTRDAWQQAITVMTPYFEAVLAATGGAE